MNDLKERLFGSGFAHTLWAAVLAAVAAAGYTYPKTKGELIALGLAVLRLLWLK